MPCICMNENTAMVIICLGMMVLIWCLVWLGLKQ